MAKSKKNLSVLERFLLQSPDWQDGYRSFNQLFGRPLGWIFILDKAGHHKLIRLDRKAQCRFYASSKMNQHNLEAFLKKYCDLLAGDADQQKSLPAFYKDVFGKTGAIFTLCHLGKLKGFLIFCSLNDSRKKLEPFMGPFNHFLRSQIEVAYKNFELNNFYETVHPRALALSTMHSVHRVISSSIRLKDLLPRIGRLSAQVLKAQGCAISLVSPDSEYLEPYFSFGEPKRFVLKQRMKIGRGVQGHIAGTGEFHLNKNSIGVPFIDDDVVGVIILWDKLGGQRFSRMDLEILKSLSEQAVVAIKNAQLYEETEQLTLGSIKAINELLAMNVRSDRGHLSLGEIALEVGKQLQLSGSELIHIQRAIMLRDAGALVSPDQVWKKEGKLTKKEFDKVKRIPIQGVTLLSSISSLKPALPIIMHHRERFDGTGYPQGLKGENIPIGARIVAVVDSFMAMISKRTYRESRSIDAALKEVEAHSGTQFDPKVVVSFLKVMKNKDIREKIEKAPAKKARFKPRRKSRTK